MELPQLRSGARGDRALLGLLHPVGRLRHLSSCAPCGRWTHQLLRRRQASQAGGQRRRAPLLGRAGRTAAFRRALEATRWKKRPRTAYLLDDWRDLGGARGVVALRPAAHGSLWATHYGQAEGFTPAGVAGVTPIAVPTATIVPGATDCTSMYSPCGSTDDASSRRRPFAASCSAASATVRQ